MKKIKRMLLFISISIVCMGTKTKVFARDYNRISGENRYLTSIEVSKKGWNKADVAVLVTGEDFPDALCATPLAAKYDAPILLNSKDKLSRKVKNEIIRLGVKKVYIIGGYNALNKEIEENIKDLDITTERVAGRDRYDTSIEIAQEISDISEIAVTTGNNFPDSISIAPIAGIKKMPIILSKKDYITEELKQFLKDNNISKSYVLGGKDVISYDVEQKLFNPERIYGGNRYQTNLKIINKFSEYMKGAHKLYIASGNNFPDALTTSAIAAKDKDILVLTDSKPISAVKSFLNKDNNSNKRIYVVGGENSIATSTLVDMLYDNTFKISNEKEYELKYELTINNKSDETVNGIKVWMNIGALNESPYQTNENIEVVGKGISIRNSRNGSKQAVINIDKLDKNENVKYEIIRRYKKGSLRYIVDLAKNSSDYSEFKEYNRYTLPEKNIESDNQLIKDKAKEIVGNDSNPYLKADKIFRFINSSMVYDTSQANKGALNALNTGKGVCEDYAQLFIALCRAEGIPARIVNGYWIKRDITDKPLLINNSDNDKDLDTDKHAWAEFYLPEYGWIIVEPTAQSNFYGVTVVDYNCFAKLTKPDHVIVDYHEGISSKKNTSQIETKVKAYLRKIQ